MVRSTLALVGTRTPLSVTFGATLADYPVGLDLAKVSLAHLDEGEFLPGLNPPFGCFPLNFALISKEVIDRNATVGTLPQHMLATRFSFSASLGPYLRRAAPLAGRYFYSCQRNAQQVLETYFLSGSYEGSRDQRVIKCLEALPSLDPFIVISGLEAAGLAVGPEYIGLQDERLASWRRSIEHDFNRVASSVIGQASEGADRRRRMLDAIWADAGAAAIMPLARALHISTQCQKSTFNSWKGLLYYRIRYGEIYPALKGILQNIDTISAAMAREKKGQRDAYAWDCVTKRLKVLMTEVEFLFQRYDELFEDFCGAKERINEFYGIMEIMERIYRLVGSNISVFYHCIQTAHAFVTSDRTIDDMVQFHVIMKKLTSFADH